MLQISTNQPDQAEISFKKAAELGPKNVNAQLALGAFTRRATGCRRRNSSSSMQSRSIPRIPALRGYVRLLMAEGKKYDAEGF